MFRFFSSQILFTAFMGFHFFLSPELLLAKSKEPIECSNNAGGEPFGYAVVAINFSSLNKIESVSLSWKKNGKPRNEIFNKKNSKLVHRVIQGEEAAENSANFGINEIEAIEVIRTDGSFIKVKINDHLYSGYPGSTIVMKVNGVEFDSSDTGEGVICRGSVMFDLKGLQD